MSRKIIIEELLSTIDVDEMISYWNSHTNAETYTKYGWTEPTFRKICDKLNLEKPHSVRIKQTCANKHKELIDRLQKQISKEDLVEHLTTHTYSQTATHFNVSLSSLLILLNVYEISNSIERKSNIRKQTCLEKYGYENSSQSPEVQAKREATCIERFGVKCNFSCDDTKQKSIKTNKEKYGTDYASQSDVVKQKIKSTKTKRYNNPNYVNTNKAKETRIKNYGTLNASYQEGLKKQSKVIQEKYNVPYACMRPEARRFTNDSNPNKRFANILSSKNIEFEREFVLSNYSFDFKIDDILVEINPFSTHNSTWGLFGDKDKKDKYYHQNKTKCAMENGFRCMHIWDWDDIDKIINTLTNEEKLYARKLTIKDVSINDTNEFLNKYHFQNTCKNQDIRLGLYLNNELVQIMTFGKPRYNKNYEWELLRLCTNSNYKIIGGSQKLFNYFIKKYNPQSIISYCDNSKFNGNVYSNLGFSQLSYGSPSKHWYNGKTKQHITDNLLRQRGADQLLGTNFGKGTSNEEILKNSGFVEIYDSGQSTFIYKI